MSKNFVNNLITLIEFNTCVCLLLHISYQAADVETSRVLKRGTLISSNILLKFLFFAGKIVTFYFCDVSNVSHLPYHDKSVKTRSLFKCVQYS
jgi:hypothetical protein